MRRATTDTLAALGRGIDRTLLLVFEYRIETELGSCRGRWRRGEISVETRRIALKRSYVNGQTDVSETARLRVLRPTAATPDDSLGLDLPTTASPRKIRDFEQAIRSKHLRSDHPADDPNE